MFEGWLPKVATDAFSAFVGGSALAGALFLIGEKVFPMPRMNGKWYFETYTEHSAYQPFHNMRLKYEAILWQEGPTVRGTVEKIYEDSVNGRRRIGGTDRTRAVVSGYVDKFYFSNDRVCLHLEESGGRTSTTYIGLVIQKKFFSKKLSPMSGIMESMIGSSSGKTVWDKNRYSQAFSENVREEISDKYGPVIHIEAEAEDQDS